MKNIYLIIVMIICFTTSLSNIGYAADLTIKVRDSKTGETIYEDEKTYTPEEREQAKQRTQAEEIYTYTDKDGRLTQNEESKLDDLYNRAISKSEEKNKSVGGAACYLCLADVISAVKSSGKSIDPRFWRLVDDALTNRRKFSVGGLLNVVLRAASIQSINTSNMSSCNTAMLHSLKLRR